MPSQIWPSFRPQQLPQGQSPQQQAHVWLAQLPQACVSSCCAQSSSSPKGPLPRAFFCSFISGFRLHGSLPFPMLCACYLLSQKLALPCETSWPFFLSFVSACKDASSQMAFPSSLVPQLLAEVLEPHTRRRSPNYHAYLPVSSQPPLVAS